MKKNYILSLLALVGLKADNNVKLCRQILCNPDSVEEAKVCKYSNDEFNKDTLKKGCETLIKIKGDIVQAETEAKEAKKIAKEDPTTENNEKADQAQDRVEELGNGGFILTAFMASGELEAINHLLNQPGYKEYTTKS